jgi:hypothetical protein
MMIFTLEEASEGQPHLRTAMALITAYFNYQSIKYPPEEVLSYFVRTTSLLDFFVFLSRVLS